MKRLTDKRLALPPGVWQEMTDEQRMELQEIPVPSKQELYYRLFEIEEILCDAEDDYDLDRLRELVEADETLREFAEDVALQFGYHGTTSDGRAAYTAGGLSTLEWAWSLLGWPDPKPAPECECEEEGCHEWASGGRPTPDGYKWLCSRHFAAYEVCEEAKAVLAKLNQETKKFHFFLHFIFRNIRKQHKSENESQI